MAGKANVSIEGGLEEWKKGHKIIRKAPQRNINKEAASNPRLRGYYADITQETLDRLKLPKKKKKGIGKDHFTKLTKKKKVRKGPISR